MTTKQNPSRHTPWSARGALLAALLTALLSTWLAVPGTAQAQTCKLGSENIVFQPYDPFANQMAEGDGMFHIECDNPLPQPIRYRLCIGLGAGSEGSTEDNRRMAGTQLGGALRYQFYQEGSLATTWTTIALQKHWQSMSQTLAVNQGPTIVAKKPLYGRILAGQESVHAPDTYTSSYAPPVDIEFRYRHYGPQDPVPTCEEIAPAPPANIVSFSLSAEVQKRCDITFGPSPLNFGTVTGPAIPTTPSKFGLRVRCTRSTPYTIALNDGLFSTTPGTRRMMHTGGPPHYVTYDIYQDESFSQRWGSTGNEILGSQTGDAGNTDFVGHGLVPAQNTTSTGTYRDRVVVTVEY